MRSNMPAEQGIIHRDIKPSNILLDVYGTAWVTDFGLAKVLGQEGLTQTGDLVGTLRYMPPERFRGQADRRGDVYALGLTLYELLALEPAFDESDRAQLIRRVTDEGPRRLTRDRRVDPAGSGNHRTQDDGTGAGRSVRHCRRAGSRPAPVPGRPTHRGAAAELD